MSITDEVARAMFPRSPNYGPHQVYTRKAIAVFAKWLREPEHSVRLAGEHGGWYAIDVKQILDALASHLEKEMGDAG